MSNRTAFFDALTEELPDDVWGNRLHTELAAHLEDAVYFGALQGKNETIAEEQALADLGSPHLILQEFRHAMTYKSPQAFVLHAIGVGLAASPLLYIVTLFLRVPPVSAIFFLLLVAFYVHTLSPILRHIESRSFQKNMIAIVTGIPIAIVTIPLTIAFFTAPASLQDASTPLFMVILGAIGGVLNIVAAIFATRYVRAQQAAAIEKGKSIEPKNNTHLRTLSIVAIVFIATSTLLEWFPVKNLAIIPKIQWLFTTMITATNAFSGVISPLSGIYITGIVVGGLGIIGTCFVIQFFVHRTKQKTQSFPWLWLVAMVYAVSLLMVPAPLNTEQVNVSWNVPYKNVSAVIERQELGPFYIMAKYLNRNTQQAFEYHLSSPDLGNTFELQQYPDHVFTLSNISTVDSYTTTTRIEDTVSFGATMNTEGIWCHYFANSAESTDPITPTGTRKELWNGPTYCTDLYVNDKKVFDAPQGIDIGRDASITVSNDGKWLLWAHDTDTFLQGSFTPTEVYLIDLR